MAKRRSSLIQEFTRLSTVYETQLGKAVFSGLLPRKKLELLAVQVYLQEKYPSHVAHVYLNMDESALTDRRLLRYILSIIKAENLGVAASGTSHSDLAKRFAYFVGVSAKSLGAARPTPANQVLMDWCDMSALDRPWLETLAVQVACESQVKTMKQIATGLQIHYGASTGDIKFWTIHGGPVERRHMFEGMALLAEHTQSENSDSIHYIYEFTCQLVGRFYDSMLEG